MESSSFWNPESTVLESGIQYPESGIHSMEFRIQDCPGFPYMGRKRQWMRQIAGQFFQKAIDIRKETWDEDGEGTDLDRANLGTFFLCVGQKAKTEKYYISWGTYDLWENW